MISQTVEVRQANADYLLVSPVQSGCQSCSSGSCGVANIANLFGTRPRTLKVRNHAYNYRVGDRVELLLDEKLFMKSVLIQYLLPLMVMFCFAIVAALLTQQLIFQSIVALLGLVAGIFISRKLINLYEYRVDDNHLKIRSLASY